MLKETDLPIEVSIYMSIFEYTKTVGLIEECVENLEKNIFANSSVDASIQNSNKRERSNDT